MPELSQDIPAGDSRQRDVSSQSDCSKNRPLTLRKGKQRRRRNDVRWNQRGRASSALQSTGVRFDIFSHTSESENESEALYSSQESERELHPPVTSGLESLKKIESVDTSRSEAATAQLSYLSIPISDNREKKSSNEAERTNSSSIASQTSQTNRKEHIFKKEKGNNNAVEIVTASTDHFTPGSTHQFVGREQLRRSGATVRGAEKWWHIFQKNFQKILEPLSVHEVYFSEESLEETRWERLPASPNETTDATPGASKQRSGELFSGWSSSLRRETQYSLSNFGISLYPLHFSSREVETAYALNIARFSLQRVPLTACVYFIFTLFVYVAISCAGGEPQFLQSVVVVVLVHAIFPCLLGSLLLLWLSYYMNLAKTQAEHLLSWFLTSFDFAIVALVTMMKAFLYQGACASRQKDRPCASDAAILLNDILLDQLASAYFYLYVFFQCIVLPLRVRNTLWHLLIVTLLQWVPSVLSLRRLGSLAWPLTIKGVGEGFFLAVALLSGLITEVQTRGRFYDWFTTQKSIAFEVAGRDQGDGDLVSDMDVVRSNCRAICRLLLQSKTACNQAPVASNISKALNAMEKTLDILASSPDLYAAQLDVRLRGQSYIQGYQCDPGQQNLRLRFPSRTLTVPDPGVEPSHSRDSSCKNSHSSNTSLELLCSSIPKPQRTTILTDLMRGPGFNPLQLRNVRHALLEVGYVLLKPLVSQWRCDDHVLRNFLWHLELHYQDNPYHNNLHAASVGYMMALLSQSLFHQAELTSLGAAAARVAALAHDVGHPGRNNAFLIMFEAPAALVYNDKSVLENFHASLTFRILKIGGCFIFEDIAYEEWRTVRAVIINLILATDMKTHFEFLNRLRLRHQRADLLCLKNGDDQFLLTELCIRAADISHGMLQWMEHFEWSSRVTAEFYLQGDEERRLGLPVSPLCDREQHMQLAKSQIGFLSHVVRPLVVEAERMREGNPFIAQLIRTLDNNISIWETLNDTNQYIRMAPVFEDYSTKLKNQDMLMNVKVLTCDHIDEGHEMSSANQSSCSQDSQKQSENSSKQDEARQADAELRS